MSGLFPQGSLSMENEFVIRDLSKLADAANTIRATDHLLQVIDETSKRIEAVQPDLAAAFDAIADVIQAAVMQYTGVDVRRVGAAATDRETGELALHSLQVNLGYDSDAGTAACALRSRQEIAMTTVHAYREHVKSGNADEAAKLLEQILQFVDSISISFGDAKSDQEPKQSSGTVAAAA